MKDAVTLKDIARATGVTAATVSMALRGHPRISVETRSRIARVAKELSYRGNPLVAALMSQVRTSRPVGYKGNLAFLNTFPSADFYTATDSYDFGRELWEGCHQRAMELGFNIESIWCREPGMTFAKVNRILEARGIHGILLPPLPKAYGHFTLDWKPLSVIALSHTVVLPRLDCVKTDHHRNMRLIIRELRHRGYRRIGLALFPHFDDRSDNRWSSFFYFYQSKLPVSHRVPVIEIEPATMDRALRWFEKYRPEVIVTNRETGIHTGFPVAGVGFPSDVGLVHVSWEASYSQCAGVDEHPRVLGVIGVDMLAEQIYRNQRGLPDHPKTVSIEGFWRDGSTLAPNPPKLQKTPAPLRKKPPAGPRRRLTS